MIAMITRGDPVRERHPDQHGQRDRHGQHELRQVPGEVGVQRVQAPGRQRGDLPGLLAAQPRRAQPQERGRTAARRSPDFTTAAARSAAASPPAAATARPATTTRQPGQRPGQRGRPRFRAPRRPAPAPAGPPAAGSAPFRPGPARRRPPGTRAPPLPAAATAVNRPHPLLTSWPSPRCWRGFTGGITRHV